MKRSKLLLVLLVPLLILIVVYFVGMQVARSLAYDRLQQFISHSAEKVRENSVKTDLSQDNLDLNLLSNALLDQGLELDFIKDSDVYWQQKGRFILKFAVGRKAEQARIVIPATIAYEPFKINLQLDLNEGLIKQVIANTYLSYFFDHQDLKAQLQIKSSLFPYYHEALLEASLPYSAQMMAEGKRQLADYTQENTAFAPKLQLLFKLRHNTNNDYATSLDLTNVISTDGIVGRIALNINNQGLFPLQKLGPIELGLEHIFAEGYYTKQATLNVDAEVLDKKYFDLIYKLRAQSQAATQRQQWDNVDLQGRIGSIDLASLQVPHLGAIISGEQTAVFKDNVLNHSLDKARFIFSADTVKQFMQDFVGSSAYIQQPANRHLDTANVTLDMDSKFALPIVNYGKKSIIDYTQSKGIINYNISSNDKNLIEDFTKLIPNQISSDGHNIKGQLRVEESAIYINNKKI